MHSEQASQSWAREYLGTFLLLLISVSVGAAALEFALVRHGGSSWSGALVLLGFVFSLSALWAWPVAALGALAVGLARRLSGRVIQGDQASLRSGLLLLPPVFLGAALAGHRALLWANAAFVDPNLTAALASVLVLVLAGTLALTVWVGFRCFKETINRLPAWASLGGAALGAVVAGAVYLQRFPEVLETSLLVKLAQLGGSVALGFLVVGLVGRGTRFRVGPGLAAAALALMLVGTALAPLAGRLVPARVPGMKAALQARGLMGATVLGAMTRLGDRDGDGFSRFELDCNDADAKVNPLAKDVPGDGVDQDCFEGDLASPTPPPAPPSKPKAPSPIPEKVRRVILITVDAVRADSTGFGGAALPVTPELDRVAAAGVIFENAMAQSPSTRRSFPSLLSGLFPSNVKWTGSRTQKTYWQCPKDNLFLAERLTAAGVKTAMVVGFKFARMGNWDQGFKTNIQLPPPFQKKCNAPEVVDKSLELLRQWKREAAADPQGRQFLWMHFFEPHQPYLAHKDFPEFGQDAQQRYLSEVRFVDRELGRFFEGLDAAGLAQDTLVIVTADHGEEFGEHGATGHGNLYPRTLRVPLVFKGPGVPVARVQAMVGLVDLAPTILELLGLAAPVDLDGRSLLGLVDGADLASWEERPAFAETIQDHKVKTRVLALGSQDWHYIVDLEAGTRELFDLRADPAGLQNLFASKPEVALQIETTLRRLLATSVKELCCVKK
jgi:arylsulfatase A-like enzyme